MDLITIMPNHFNMNCCANKVRAIDVFYFFHKRTKVLSLPATVGYHIEFIFIGKTKYRKIKQHRAVRGSICIESSKTKTWLFYTSENAKTPGNQNSH